MKLQERTHTKDSKSKSKMSENAQTYDTLLNSNAVRKKEQTISINTKSTDNINNNSSGSIENNEGNHSCKSAVIDEHKKVLVNEKVYNKENMLVPRPSAHTVKNNSSITNNNSNAISTDNNTISSIELEENAFIDDFNVLEHDHSKDE